MSEAIWFTDRGYSEVSDSIATLLVNNIDSIESASEPSTPGDYYGTIEGQQDVTVVFPRDDSYVDDLNANTVTAQTATMNEAVIEENPLKQLRSETDLQRRYSIAGTQLDTLNSLDGWTVTHGEIEQSSDGYITDNSIFLRRRAEDSRTRIERDFDTPRDFSEVDFTIGFKHVSDASDGHGFWLELTDNTGTKAYLTERVPSESAGTWLRLSLGPRLPLGGWDTIDLTQISQIAINSNSGPPGGVHEYHVNDLRMTPKASKGYIMFSFDDAGDTDYTQALPILARYGFSGTSFIITNRIGDSGRLSLEQLHEMRDRGWCVSSHGADHMNHSQNTEADIREDLAESRRFLLENGFERGADYFRFPYSNDGATALDVVLDYFDIAFSGSYATSSGGTVMGPLKTGHAKGADDYTNAINYIDTAATHRYLTMLTMHTISDPAGFENVVSHARDLVDAGQLEVIQPWDLLSGQAARGTINHF